jgi:DNA-binding NarL/FixJ family response regulator
MLGKEMLAQRTVISEPEDLVLAGPSASGGPRGLGGGDIRSEAVARVNSRPVMEGSLKVAIVDGISFTRECIDISITNLSGQPPCRKISETQKFASCNEIFSCDARFDIIVYHFHDPQGDSLADLRKLTELAAVIVLSIEDSAESVRMAFDHGARGYITTTNTGLKLLLEILHFVHAGGTFIPPSILARSELPQKERQRLTEREMLILDLLKKGKQNKVIAYELGLSESTVKVHIRHILDKLRARNRTEAVSAAMQVTGNPVAKL